MSKNTKPSSEPWIDPDDDDAMSDEDVDYSDVPATDVDFWQAAEVNFPSVKQQVTLCIDPKLSNRNLDAVHILDGY